MSTSRLAKELIQRYSHINWALADQALVSMVNFLTGVLLARYLGIDEFGRFALAWTVVLFVIGLQQSIITAPMMSIGPKQSPDDAAPYYGAVVTQQILLAVAAFFLVWGGALITDLIFPSWRVAGLALPLAGVSVAAQFQEFLRRYYFSKRRVKSGFAIDVLRYGSQLAVLLLLFRNTSMDSATTLWVIAAAALIAGVAGSFHIDGIKWTPHRFREFASRNWRFSRWLVATSLLHLVAGNLFMVAAAFFFGAAAAGALRAAQNLVGVTGVLFQAMDNFVPVRAALHYQDGGPAALHRYLRRVTFWGGILVVVILATAAAVPEFWMQQVFGKEYLEHAYLLRWFALLHFLMFLMMPFRIERRTIEQTNSVFLAYLGQALVTFALVYPIEQYFGIKGAVIGMVIAQAVQVLVLALLPRTHAPSRGQIG